MEGFTGLVDALKSGGPYAIAAVFIVGWWLDYPEPDVMPSGAD